MKESKNKLAEKLFGFRPAGQPIDEPLELGYHCPVCEYELDIDKNKIDERLEWSEYRCFLYCRVCNKDYPSALCMPDIDKAIEFFFMAVKTALEVKEESNERNRRNRGNNERK
jgi:hypothetical protein